MKPIITYDTATATWTLMEAFTYRGHGHEIAIPQGFTFDLASIPRFFWRFVAPFELSITAPLVHDFLYVRGGRLPGKKLSKQDADDLFHRIMRDEGVPVWRRKPAYQAVRWFGKGAF